MSLTEEFERLMESPEVIRYFEVLEMIRERDKSVKISAPSIADYMRFRRETLEMTQAEYAEKLGWSEGIIKGIENGGGINLKKAKRLFKDGYPPKILFS